MKEAEKRQIYLNEMKECVKSLQGLLFGPDSTSSSQATAAAGNVTKAWSCFDDDLNCVRRICDSLGDQNIRATDHIPGLDWLRSQSKTVGKHLPILKNSEVERRFCAHFVEKLSSASVEPVPPKKIRLSTESNPGFANFKPAYEISRSIASQASQGPDSDASCAKVNRKLNAQQKLNYRHEGNGFNPPRVQPNSGSQEDYEAKDTDVGPGSVKSQSLELPGGNWNVRSGFPNKAEDRRLEIQKKRFPAPVQEYETDRRGRVEHSSRSISKANFDDKAGDESSSQPNQPAFRTAHQQLILNDRAKGIKRTINENSGPNVHVSGLRKPARYDPAKSAFGGAKSKSQEQEEPENPELEELMQNPRMKNIDPKMVETILNEVFSVDTVDWNDIAGLDGVKSIIKEIIIWPMLRPDIFTGLRGPPKGILLFGPPGTGKTMIGRLIATQSKSSFFNISASSLTSKWIGDGEKMVRALFAVARVKQPAVIFIDEIDSILTQRSETEHESSRRLKTEFLIQFDGCGTNCEDRILVIGVTNRPQELDEAARRRLVKRIYIPLPDFQGRKMLVQNLMGKQHATLTVSDYDAIAEMSTGFSGADMTTLCQEASYGPIRDVGVDIQNICADQVRPIMLKDFQSAVKHVKASVDSTDLVQYEEWDRKFGCHL